MGDNDAKPGGTPERILIVDDHPIIRHGLQQLINDETDLLVCAAAANSAEALAAIGSTSPDLVIVDLSLGDENGLALLKEIKSLRPDLPVLVLSMHDETYYADRVLRGGAMGYVMKQEAPERVIAAIHQVLDGKVYLSETMAASMLNRMVGRKETKYRSPIDILTDRELQVLQLIGRGLATRHIAEKLHLSVKTIENHREHIKAKLNLQSSSELVHYAVRWEIEGG